MQLPKYIVIVTLFFLFILPGFSQTNLHLGWEQILDNREYLSPVQKSQTILGMRSFADLSYKFDSTSMLVGGGSFLYEYGSRSKHLEPDLTAYYQYNDNRFRMNFGAFPRKNLLNYPLALLEDSLLYYRPNIEGGFFQFGTHNFRQNVWCDWTSRQTLADRENFLFGASGALNLGPVFIHNYFVLLHNAFAKIKVENDHVQDNGGVLIRLGLNLKQWVHIDSLSVSGGCLQFIERRRSVTDFILNRGAVLEMSAQYKKFGMNALHFQGKGELLIFGDRFYQADKYTRLAIYWLPFKCKGISSRLELNFHYTKGHNDSSQKFFIYADIDKLFKR